MTTQTKPITITPEQYERGYFAIDRATADHYFINNEGNERICLWVCNDQSSLKQTYEDMGLGENSADIVGEYIIDENGNEIEIEAIVYPTNESLNDLDLDALAEGFLKWK